MPGRAAPPSSQRMGLPWVALAGPTASGKTAMALEIARQQPVEIVSVDSALVYRGMDIGTAKPSLAERAQVPHHLIDLLDPAESYSAARFVRDACRLVAEIHARGRIPLLVGGTMLYFHALMVGMDVLPEADPLLRAELEERARNEGWPALHAELQRLDPATAQRLAPHDAQRIQRALEVIRLSGRPMSEQLGRPAAPALPPPALFLSFEPLQRAWLHERIARRFDEMLAEGFLDEVRALRRRGDLHAGLPSMRCVGYRQAWALLDRIGTEATPSPQALAAWREQGIAATRQLAKRQMTWLRSMPQRQVLPADDPGVASFVASLAFPAPSMGGVE